jgi:hypothetical protein
MKKGRKMNTKKIVGVACMGVLAGVFLVGCGGGASSNTNPSNTSGNAGNVQENGTPTKDFLPNYVPSIDPLWYWPKRDLRLSIDQGAETSTRAALFAKACENWGTVTQNEIRPSVTTGAVAEIQVTFVPEGTLGNAIGITDTLAESQTGKIVRADIKIVRGLSDAELLLTIEHELSHAFGVGGHSPSQKDIMFPTPRVGTPISTSDINTVLYAYRNITRAPQTGATSTGPLVTHRVY